MALDSKQRDVLFRMGVVQHPELKTALKAIGDQVEKTQSRISSAYNRVATEEKKSAADSLAHRKSVQKEHESILQRQMEWEKKAQMAEMSGIARNKAAYIEYMQLSLREAEKVYKNRMQLAAKTMASERRERDANAREEAAQLRLMESQRTAAYMRIQGATHRLTSVTMQATHGVAQLARGFAMLGVVNQETSEQMLRGIAKIQSVFDIFVGGVKTIRAVSMAYESLKTIQATTSLIKTIGAGAAMGGGVAASAAMGAAGGAAKFLGEAGAKGVAAEGANGLARKAVPWAARAAGFGVAAAPWLAAGLGVGAGVLGGGSAIRGMFKYGLGGGADVGSIADWIATKEVGAASMLHLPGTGGLNRSSAAAKKAQKDLLEKQARTAYQEELGGAEASAYSARVGVSRERMQSMLEGPGTSRQASPLNSLVSRQQSQLAAAESQGRFARTAAQQEAHAQQRQSMQNAMFATKDRAIGAEGGYRMSRISAAMGVEQGQVGTATRLAAGATNEAQREGYLKAAADAEARIAALKRESLSVEKEIAATRRQNIADSIRGLEQERDRRLEIIKVEQDRYLTAKEKFGQMSQGEQQQAIRTKIKAETQGYGSLTRSERSRLRGLGTEREQERVKQADLATAQAAGFDRFFGEEERRRVGVETAAQKNIDVQLKGRQELVIKDERRVEDLAREIGNEVQMHLARRDQIILQTIQTQLGNNKTAIVKQEDERQAQKKLQAKGK